MSFYQNELRTIGQWFLEYRSSKKSMRIGAIPLENRAGHLRNRSSVQSESDATRELIQYMPRKYTFLVLKTKNRFGLKQT